MNVELIYDVIVPLQATWQLIFIQIPMSDTFYEQETKDNDVRGLHTGCIYGNVEQN